MTSRFLTVVTAAVAVGGLLAACSHPDDRLPPAQTPPAGGQPSASAPPPPAEPYPPSGKVFLGLQTNLGPFDFTQVDAFAAATEYQPSALQFSQGWAADTFNRAAFDAIVARDMLPILSWEPWDYTARGRGASSGDQPAYRLSAITSGKYDGYVRGWAHGIAGLPYPVVIRFAHEMNGFWYPWCEQSNGNRRGDYIKAWRHIHDLFTEAGAENVTWLWSPNVTYPGASPLKNLYPGDEYVDWVGLSGYYGTEGHEGYVPFDTIFRRTFAELKSFTSKPVVITETGATNASGQQARWITDMFAQLPRYPNVIGVIWFETVKEIDWRIAVVPASARAFAAGAADPRYDAPWRPNHVPRG